MLIFESTDLAGKSTLIGKLLPKIAKTVSTENRGVGEVVVQHFGRLPEEFDYYKGYLDRISIDRISDRFHFSELVYGPIMRSYLHPRFDISRREMVQLELLVTGSLVVYCRPSLSVLEERLNKRGDDYISRFETIQRIVEEYDALEWGIPWVTVDTDGDTCLEEQLILDKWEPLRHRAHAYEKLGGKGWGTLEQGKLLVIGERPNHGPDTFMKYHLRPFGAPKPHGSAPDAVSHSSDWVFSMLRGAGLQPTDYHVTNAYYHGPSETYLADEVDFLRPKKIVVMGNVARQLIVDELHLDDNTHVFIIPHPQYLRRFHQDELSRFVDALRSFIMSDAKSGAVEMR